MHNVARMPERDQERERERGRDNVLQCEGDDECSLTFTEEDLG